MEDAPVLVILERCKFGSMAAVKQHKRTYRTDEPADDECSGDDGCDGYCTLPGFESHAVTMRFARSSS
jgi:hypothetical protein